MRRWGPARSLAQAAGRGFVVNFTFDATLQSLVIVQTVLVSRLLGPEDIGLFGLAAVSVSIGVALKELGIQQKLIQEQQADLALGYSVAFTLELLLATVTFLIVAALAPLMAHLFHRSQLFVLIVLLGLTIYTSAFLGLPGALFLRRLDYVRENLVSAIAPVLTFAVTVPLAFAGAGVWSLVAGSLTATVAAAAALAWVAPLRPRLRLDGPVLRRYLTFGWPLWAAGLLGLSSTWVGSLVVTGVLGISALGFFSLAQAIASQAIRVDALLADTIFPALCRIQDDIENQRRAFVLTNRVTALWAGVIGFGLAVFAGDLVRILLGHRWLPSIFLFRMEGVSPRKYLAWSPTHTKSPNFHVPESFGGLVLDP